MSRPVVLLPTYARVQWLEEQLACLLAQDMACDVIILNDCPWQTLSFVGFMDDAVRVSCVNADHPFPNMGAKRNHMLDLAGDRIALWADDDDLCFPWYVRSFMFFIDGNKHRWAASLEDYALEGDSWKLQKWPLACAGPAKEWIARGGAAEIDNGEDKTLRKNIDPKATFFRYPGYIYRWGQGTYHLSGAGQPVAFDRYRADAEVRRQSKTEPEGLVRLHPCLRKKYWSGAPLEVGKMLRKYDEARWAYDLAK